MRAVVHLLTRQLNLRRSAKVYITEQTTVFYHFIKSNFFPNLIGSEFLGARCSLGHENDGIRNEDMTRLTFGNESLDVILSFDVLEDIGDYQTALREAYRCLAPGGIFVMTAPFDLKAKNTCIRARVLMDGEIDHLLPPEYHGDSINPEKGVLCFQKFGWDFLDELRDIGFSNVEGLDYWVRNTDA